MIREVLANRRLHTTTGIPNAVARRATLLADAAEADEAERPAEQTPAPSSIPSCSSVPARRSATLSGDAAVEREHQREGELRDRDGVLARAVRDIDAAARRGAHVDRVVRPRPRGRSSDRIRCVEHRIGHLGAANDEHVGAWSTRCASASC